MAEVKKLTARTSLTKQQARKDLVRTETLNGREYMVAPVVPFIEGVHNAEFVSYEEMSVFPEAWDGRPLPIDHPTGPNGEAVTAGSPQVMQDSVVGFLFNVVARDDIRGISGEIWVDIEKAKTVAGGQEVLNKLQAGTPLEVSTAYYTFVDNTPGEWKNPNDGTVEKYYQTQHGLRPDHLALLPFDLGACSWKDGCGAPRLNSDGHAVVSPEEGKKSPMIDNKLVVNGAQLGRAMKAALAAHAGTDGTASEMVSRLAAAAGIEVSRVQDLIAGTIDFAPRGWLNIFAAVLDVDPYDLFMAASNDNMEARYTEVTNNETVTTTNSEISKEKNIQTEENTLTTSHNEAEGATCGCQKTFKSKVVDILQSLGFKSGVKEEQTQNMATEVNTNEQAAAAKKARVDALIASAKTQFAENNRDWLMTMGDDQLALLEPKAETAAAPAPVAAAATTEKEVAAAATTGEVKQLSAKEIGDIMATALETFAKTNPALQAAQSIVDDKKNARAAKISQIAAFETNKFEKAELENMSDGTLDKILDSLEPTYRVAPGARRVANVNDVPAAPAILLAAPTKGGK